MRNLSKDTPHLKKLSGMLHTSKRSFPTLLKSNIFMHSCKNCAQDAKKIDVNIHCKKRLWFRTVQEITPIHWYVYCFIVPLTKMKFTWSKEIKHLKQKRKTISCCKEAWTFGFLTRDKMISLLKDCKFLLVSLIAMQGQTWIWA